MSPGDDRMAARKDVESPHQIAAAPQDVVELARALVQVPSVNPGLEEDGAGEAKIARLAASWLDQWGYRVRLVEAPTERYSVVGTLERGAGRSLILSGHLDTVGVAAMTVPAFSGDLRDGRLWGRGAADMKGGVAAALAAARDAAREPSDGGTGIRGRLTVVLTADEEEAAVGCRRLLEEGLAADGAIVCEPTGLAIMPAHKGFAWIQVDFRGQAAHGSRPERGVDAIRHAGLFLARLDEIETTLSRRSAHPLLGHGSIHAGTIRGGSAASVYPDSCCLTLERRMLPGETEAAVASEVEYLLAELRTDVPSLRAEVSVVLHQPGSQIEEDHELVRVLESALSAGGIEPRIEGMSAWVEADLFNHSGTPALCFGPGSIGDAHSADESAPVEEIRRAHVVLLAAIRRFLS